MDTTPVCESVAGSGSEVKEPNISVIIPTYNRSGLVVNAIESVLRQTYRDYELIVVDDGSSDDTRHRLRPYMERIRYVYQDNRGASAAQNAGIRVARGKRIAILASDDEWHPDKLQRQIEALAALGGEYGACFTDCRFVGNEREDISAFQNAGLRMPSAYGPIDEPARYILWSFGLYVQSLLVLRSLVNEIDGFDEGLGVSEDDDLVFRLSLKTRFCAVSEPLVTIDRSRNHSRLIDVFRTNEERRFISSELFLIKVLAYPEALGGDLYRALEKQLVQLYFDWVMARAAELNLASVMKSVGKLHDRGLGYGAILKTVSSRVRRKLIQFAKNPGRAWAPSI